VQLTGANSLGDAYRSSTAEGDTLRAVSAALRAAHWFEQQGDFRNAGVWHREVYYSVYLQRSSISDSPARQDSSHHRYPTRRGLALISAAKRGILSFKFYDAIKALAEAEKTLFPGCDDSLTLARFYGCRALCHDRLDESDTAITDYKQAVKLMIDSGHYSRAASYLNNIGFCLSENQEWEKGEQYILQGLELIRKQRVRHVEAALYDSLGYTYTMMRNFEKAEVFLDRARRLFESCRDPISWIGSYLRLYAFHRVAGNYDAARAIAHRSFELAADLKSQPLLDEVRLRLSYFDLPHVSKGSRLKLFHGILYSSSEVESTVSDIRATAPSGEPMLILGETGTGKELVAHAIHEESNCRKGPFVPFNCSLAIKGLAESQLFGHIRGAFTDARADQPGVIRAAEGGSLFLDEIGDLELGAQASLLRFLQTGEVQPVGAKLPVKMVVRVIAAANRDLEEDARSGRFRLDLYHRLNVVTLRLPPLRERLSDIVPLAIYFTEIWSERHRKPKPVLGSEERSRLRDYHWPGNIRELENYCKRRVLLGDQAINWLIERHSLSGRQDPNRDTNSIWRNLTKSEKIARIGVALERTSGNLTHAARLLGISRRTIQLLRKD
jgi:DNA-binding NtrC family response regulator/Tfp pilus assembly protein PilF